MTNCVVQSSTVGFVYLIRNYLTESETVITCIVFLFNIRLLTDFCLVYLVVVVILGTLLVRIGL